MVLLMSRLEVSHPDMQVDRSRLQFRVPHHALDMTQVAAVL